MKTVELKKRVSDGSLIQASFAIDQGMNLLSYKKGDREVIAQSTKGLFLERFAGLGALIGPHFHHRSADAIPAVLQEERFPHIAKVRQKGGIEPFSHGIARYAPWRLLSNSEAELQAEICGSDSWQGSLLKELEGQDFQMQMTASLQGDGLHLKLSVKSERASIVGIHYYFDLPSGGQVLSEVQEKITYQGAYQDIPASFNRQSSGKIALNAQEVFDHGFRPLQEKGGSIALDTPNFRLLIDYRAEKEHSWQLFHPKDASFICIEPLSANSPRQAILTESSIEIALMIENKESL
ncbi:MAG: hypothetical protein K0S07_1129 [Chlamydiales bacterium]|jgi:hypothetical protein|nr:hypothetical protein [Chlamydiales bacterium]